MDTNAGLRERKKMATRTALHQAAVRLAADQGLDKVTVEAICDAADVSRRTFSNHFASKEEALLYSDHERLRRFVTLVRERPATETPWQALTAAVEGFNAEGPAFDEEFMDKLRMVRRHISLATHQAATYAAVERDLAAEIATRLPEATASPLRARLLAAATLTSMRVSFQYWLDQPDAGLDQLRLDALGIVGEKFD
ncbi:TetR/AcrR family transcriptional regulator [Phytomonospora endophytica]|uniref:AcrR family transcriptional regulator n=1 Tax=Phytomonospora endophytica TaxID=714109 RepID=A0A841G275_9ACTN|nr:TetR family transcriptional regulator [Phytomonospora endophytica]MBB6038799.1 AcrR family transcriptional regulator [Phytomonospora endophytica]GIG68405.1 TetR family transcriptional regulator [Phytomonospora endophytica]